MTSEDFDTWLVVYSQFVGADSKSGISVALSNAHETQDSCKINIITAEMSHGNGSWHARLTLHDIDPGQLYMAPRYL